MSGSVSVSILESNNYLIDLIKNNNQKPFLVGRLGTEVVAVFNFVVNNKLTYPVDLSKNAGIYIKDANQAEQYLQLYYLLYYKSIIESDAIGIFRRIPVILKEEEYVVSNLKKKELASRSLEPFYVMMEGGTPWTHFLLGKKVLIVSPFVESFKKQIAAGFRMFKSKRDGDEGEDSDSDKDIFLPGQEFVFYKSFNTLAGNHIHQSWYETFNIMCNDIKFLDFDVALLSCGGYGMPLCNFIKNDLNKSAIYVGGGLQLLFGVIGQRWLTHPTILEIIKENDTKFIRPYGNEIVNNNGSVERGCYW